MTSRRVAVFGALLVVLTVGASLAALGAKDFLDHSFGTDGVAVLDLGKYDYLSTVAIDDHGRIVVAGSAQPSGDPDRHGIVARYLADGTLDPTFGASGVVELAYPSSFGFSAIGFQSDGKIVVSGQSVTDTETLTADFLTARLTTAGNLDPSFGTGGYAVSNFDDDYGTPYDLAVLPDDRIVIAGTAGEAASPGDRDLALMRLTPDGSPDSTFSGDGVVKTAIGPKWDSIHAIDIDASDRVVVAGYTEGTTASWLVARYEVDGTLDSSFHSDGVRVVDFGSSAIANDVVVQPDGKIVVVGWVRSSNDVMAIMRFDPDGTEDLGFGSSGLVTVDATSNFDELEAVGITGDGAIIGVGTAALDSKPALAVLLLETDGTPASTFGVGGLWHPVDGIGHGAGLDVQVLSNDGAVVVGYLNQSSDGDPDNSLDGFLAMLLGADNAPPVIDAASFEIGDNAPLDTVVGTVNAVDPEGEEVVFSIIGGDIDSFVIDPLTGAISVASTLDYTRQSTYELVVDVSDGQLASSEVVTISLVDEPAFGDVSIDHVFYGDIEWLRTSGVTFGCNPDRTEFCPDAFVTRGQMAAFLVRALHYGDQMSDPFLDDDDSMFEADIEKLAAAGVTKGCNPPANDRYCPDAYVTRDQMAAFLVRVLGLTEGSIGNRFLDDDDSIFEADIEKLAAAGVTKGCNPPANDRYCPHDRVTRAQMAAFLRRALGS